MRKLLLNSLLISVTIVSAAFLGCGESRQPTTAPAGLNAEALLLIADADLVVTEFAVVAWNPPNITYSWTVTNIGSSPAVLEGPTGGDADNVSVQAFLSSDTVFNNAGDIAAGGTILGSSPLADLGPGESISGSFTSTPAANACDYPYLVLMVDWGASLDETDETNNTASAVIDCRPDLILTEFTLDSFTPTGVSYSWTIKNVGIVPAVMEGPTGADADNVSVQAFLSDDTIFNNAGDSPAGGTIVGNSPLADLDPGQTLSGSFSSGVFEEPCDFAYLVLMVDWGAVVDESDETNNTLAASIVCVEIDIKPGSDVNPINPKSNGVIPVAIYGSASLDVSDIDPDTIVFGPSGAYEVHGTAHIGDLNNDGYPDLMLHFRTQETGIAVGDTEACLSASFLGGDSFTACDHIVTVPVAQIAP